MKTIGNEELADAEKLTKGQEVVHLHDDGSEEVATIKLGTDPETGEESNTIQYYCLADGRMFLAGLHSKKVPGNFALKRRYHDI